MREAVVTIQGGGVYGLSLLGQLEAVLARYAPVGFAGTSAGAIVATLAWAKLKPTVIRERFVSLAKARGGLGTLLGSEGTPQLGAISKTLSDTRDLLLEL